MRLLINVRADAEMSDGEAVDWQTFDEVAQSVADELVGYSSASDSGVGWRVTEVIRARERTLARD